MKDTAQPVAATATPDILSAHRRWLIVGSGGSGKSTLARRMGVILGLPVVHLDRHYWQPGWVEPSPAAWAGTVARLVADEAWVMEGNYGGTAPARLTRADAVVFLDLPAWRCIARIVRRRLTRGPRSDLPDGLDDRLDWAFLHYVLTYPSGGRKRMIAHLSGAPHVPVYRLRTPGDVRRFEALVRQAVAGQPGR